MLQMKIKIFCVVFFAFLMHIEIFAQGEDSQVSDVDYINTKYVAELLLNGRRGTSVTIVANEWINKEMKLDVLVRVVPGSLKSKRIYVTQGYQGEHGEPCKLSGYHIASDGSMKMSDNYGPFVFKLPIKLLDKPAEDHYEYKVWITSGVGDHKKTEKNLSVGVGSIIVDYHDYKTETAKTTNIKEINGKNDVRNFVIKLAAPLMDGSSKSFASLSYADVFSLKDDKESLPLIDFGYYFLERDGASLASPAGFSFATTFKRNNNIITTVDVNRVAKEVDLLDLNQCFFKKSQLSVAEFDQINSTDELDFIVQSNKPKITKIQKDDVIEFVAKNGKKGLIKVEHISGSYNRDDFILLDIKLQP